MSWSLTKPSIYQQCNNRVPPLLANWRYYSIAISHPKYLLTASYLVLSVSNAAFSCQNRRQRQPDQSDQWCPRCQHHQFLGGGALTGVSHEDVQEGGVVLQLWSAKSVGLYNYVKICHNNIMTRIWTKFSSKSYTICIEKCEIWEIRQIKFLDMSHPGSANGLLPDGIHRHSNGSTLLSVMTCHLTAPNLEFLISSCHLVP